MTARSRLTSALLNKVNFVYVNDFNNFNLYLKKYYFFASHCHEKLDFVIHKYFF